MPTTQTPSKNDQWLFYSFIGLIFFLPLPLGGNRAWAWSIVEIWTFVNMAYWLMLYIKGSVKPPPYWKQCWLPICTLAAFSMVILIQVLPIYVLAPSAINTLGQTDWSTTSLDPHSTWVHWLKTLAYTCLCAQALLLVNSEKRLKMILKVFFFSGLCQATYGGLMTLSNIEYGFFVKKTAYIGHATGTFINRNNFANYLIMCIAAGTALLLIDLSKKRSSNWRETFAKLLNFLLSKKMLLRVGLAISVTGIVLSHSRMGNISFFVCLFTAGALWIFLAGNFSIKAVLLFVSFLIIDVAVVGYWFGFDQVVQRLQNTSSSSETRDEVFRDTQVYINDNLALGTGGGSYYAVFPSYKQSDVNGFYNHTHNDYLQFLSEYGVLGSIFIIIFVFASLYNAIKGLTKRKNSLMQATCFASIMVITALLVHSLVDFNLQMTANAASAVILMSLAWVARHIPTSTTRRRRAAGNH